MAMKSMISILVVFVVVTLSSTAAVDGSFVSVNPKDPYVVKLADYAVTQYKKDILYLEHVIKADYNNDSQGSTYKLDIAGRGHWGVANYSAVLLVRGDYNKIISFGIQSLK